MANTPLGYPYPVGTDRVMDGDDAIHNLASAVDNKLGLGASGIVTVAVTALGAPGSTTVTFPASRFTVAPFVCTAIVAANPQQWNNSNSNSTKTGMTVYASRSAGAVPANVDVHWFAHQPG
jgi:hypothetical protein